MVLISDGKSGNAVHEWRKTGLFGQTTIWFVTALDLVECLENMN